MENIIESYIRILIEHHIIDNSAESESLAKYLEILENFDD